MYKQAIIIALVFFPMVAQTGNKPKPGKTFSNKILPLEEFYLPYPKSFSIPTNVQYLIIKTIQGNSELESGYKDVYTDKPRLKSWLKIKLFHKSKYYEELEKINQEGFDTFMKMAREDTFKALHAYDYEEVKKKLQESIKYTSDSNNYEGGEVTAWSLHKSAIKSFQIIIGYHDQLEKSITMKQFYLEAVEKINNWTH